MTKKQQTTAHFSFGLGGGPGWPGIQLPGPVGPARITGLYSVKAGDVGRGRMFEGDGISRLFRLDDI